MAAQHDHTARPPAPHENLPRITIEQSPVNDLYLILDTLLPAAKTVRILHDPAGFVRSHEESLRAVWRLLEHPVDDSAAETAADAASRQARSAPQRERQVRRRRPTPGTSLLR